MQLIIREDSVEIDGYVNAIERKSKPLASRLGNFVERICKGAFKKALDRNDDVRLLLNHDWERDLGGTKDGNLELTEDNIGLRARATITDKEVVEKARKGDLVGWSFGFTDREVENHTEDGMPMRDVRDLDLYEVSLLDRTKIPAYDGTLVTVRADEEIQYHGEPLYSELEVRDLTDLVESQEETQEEPKQHSHVEEIDYSEYEAMVKKMKEDIINA